jgi:hypothetical protein
MKLTRENRNTRGNTCPSATLPTINLYHLQGSRNPLTLEDWNDRFSRNVGTEL